MREVKHNRLKENNTKQQIMKESNKRELKAKATEGDHRDNEAVSEGRTKTREEEVKGNNLKENNQRIERKQKQKQKQKQNDRI